MDRVLSEGGLSNKRACFLAEMDVEAPRDNRKTIPGIYLCSSHHFTLETAIVFGRGLYRPYVIKERLHLELKLKVKINAHGKNSWNPTRTVRLIIFS